MSSSKRMSVIKKGRGRQDESHANTRSFAKGRVFTERLELQADSLLSGVLRFARAGIFSALLLGLVLGSSAPLYAAGKSSGKSGSGPAKGVSSEDPAAGTAAPPGQDTEKLLYTLNETLSENRKIRESMRDLQSAFEKMAIEKSDLVDQVKKVEKLAIQRNKDTGRQVDQLTAQLEQSKKDLAKFQAENAASVKQKMELEKKLEALSAENAKTNATLKIAILPEERDQVVARMNQNDEAVKDAVSQISSLDGENVALKEQLIQSYFDLGNMYYDLGRYPEAVQQYLHVLEWNPNHAWSHHNLAIIYDYHMHKLHAAMAEYTAYMNVRLASEEAREVRMRLWDLQQIAKLEPDPPLQKDFKEYRAE